MNLPSRIGLCLCLAAAALAPARVAAEARASDPASGDFVADVNGNGLDQADLDAWFQGSPPRTGREIGRALAARPRVAAARFVLLGEMHRWTPTGVTQGLVEALVQAGRPVTYAYELPPANRDGAPVLRELADLLNRRRMLPEDFGRALVEAIKADPSLRALVEPDGDNVAGAVHLLVQAARAGARIALVDEAHFATPEAIGDPDRPSIRRDAVMAEALLTLGERAGAGGVVVFGAGLFHAQRRPAMTRVDLQGSASLFAADPAAPAGAVLAARAGEEAVFAAAVLGDIVPLFMRGTPLSAWDAVLGDPDGSYMPDWLDPH